MTLHRLLAPWGLLLWAGGGSRWAPCSVFAYPGDPEPGLDVPETPAPPAFPLSFVVKTAAKSPTRRADDALIEASNPEDTAPSYYFTAVASSEELRSNLALNSHALKYERAHGPASEWAAIDAALEEAAAAEGEIVEVVKSPTHTQRKNRRYVWTVHGEPHAGRSAGPVRVICPLLLCAPLPRVVAPAAPLGPPFLLGLTAWRSSASPRASRTAANWPDKLGK